MSAEVASLSVVIRGDAKDAENKISGVNSKVKESAGFFKTALSSALGFAGGALIVKGVGAAVGFVHDNLSDMIKSGMDANREMDILTQGLKSTHDASGMTAQGLDDLSGKIMNMSGIDDDSVKSAEQMLLTFTGLGKSVFPAATQAVADMTTRMNGGAIPSAQQMNTIALQLGKALNDPAKGMQMLTREGVTFTDQQKKQITAMVNAGNVAGAQKLMLQELNKEFGGSAAAAGHANGGIAILTATMDNAKQTIGQALVPVLVSLGNTITPLITGFANALPGAIKTVQDTFHTWLPVLQTAWNTLQQLGQILMIALKPAFDTLSKAFQDTGKHGADVQGAIQTINNIFNQAVPIVDAFAGILNKLAAWFVSTGLPAIRQFGQFVQTSVLPILQQFGNFILTTVLPALGNIANFVVTQVVPAVEQLWTWFGQKVLPILEQVVKTFTTDVLPTLEMLFETITHQLVPALEGLWNAISPALIPALGFLGGVLSHVVGPALKVVIDIISGLINALTGIVGAVGWVLGKIGDFVGGVLGWFGNLFDSLVGHSTIPDLINGIVQWFLSLPGKVLGIIGGMVGGLLGAIGGLKDKAIDFIIVLAIGLVAKFEAMKNQAVGKIRDLASGILGALQSLPGKLLTLGENLIKSIIQGVQNMAGSLGSAIQNTVGSAINNIPGVGGLLSHIPGFASGGSPSGLFYGAENGPELLVKPGLYAAPAGSRVYNASDTRDILGGGGTHLHFAAGAVVIQTQGPANGAQIADAFLREMDWRARGHGG